MRSRSARILSAVVAIGAPLGIALFAPVDHGPVLCAFRRFFGIPCPGCGMTRSLVALVHLDLRSAFAFHPLGPIVIPYLAALWSTAWISYAHSGNLVSRLAVRIPAWAHLGLLGLVLVVWILRFLGLLGGPVA
jgi:uncharacterized protein DUF2752